MKLSRPGRRAALNFPNRSHSFDGARDRVCFWGHASAIEISFYVDTAALRKFVPEMEATEAGVLMAFDAGRGRIEEVALPCSSSFSLMVWTPLTASR